MLTSDDRQVVVASLAVVGGSSHYPTGAEIILAA
jgi:hypothetical protein